MDSPHQVQWEGKFIGKIAGYMADEAWILLKNFWDINKFIPQIKICYIVEGKSGEPGCIRFCGSNVEGEGNEDTAKNWAKEKLISIDHTLRTYTYTVVESNMGLRDYRATIKLSPFFSPDADNNNSGCILEWSFVTEPVENWTIDALRSYVGELAMIMFKNVEEALRATL